MTAAEDKRHHRLSRGGHILAHDLREEGVDTALVVETYPSAKGWESPEHEGGVRNNSNEVA